MIREEIEALEQRLALLREEVATVEARLNQRRAELGGATFLRPVSMMHGHSTKVHKVYTRRAK